MLLRCLCKLKDTLGGPPRTRDASVRAWPPECVAVSLSSVCGSAKDMCTAVDLGLASVTKGSTLLLNNCHSDEDHLSRLNREL